MKSFALFVIVLLGTYSVQAQNVIEKARKELEKSTGLPTGGSKSLSGDEIISGLKEALNVGTSNASNNASKLDGFYKNPLIKIPFPQDVAIVEKTARQLGLGKQADNFIRSMNRAAEDASKQAAPIFLSAIKSMTIQDGLGILKGHESAATDYLKSKTTAELTQQLTPIVKRAISKAQVAKYWKPVIKKYNKIPGVAKKNPNLESYITEKTIQGLFKLIAQEEAKIRKDPAARVSDLLKKVFSN